MGHSVNNSMDGLIGIHLQALQDNSDNIVDLLEVLSERKDDISPKEMNQLKRIKKEMKSIDRRIDKIDKKKTKNMEDDYFEF